jgi:predicted AlkP superfamily phosphohydrolase/phosphomutase
MIRDIIPRTVRSNLRERIRAYPWETIDFRKSKVYLRGHSIPFGAIYLNLRGREPEGIVREADREALRNRLISDLESAGEDVGGDLKIMAYKPEEIYKGRFTEMAPDVIFVANNLRCIVSEEASWDKIFRMEAFSSRHTGSHRMEGIFMANGPDIKNGGRIKRINIVDVMPTVLSLARIPIPDDIDGRVLSEVLVEPTLTEQEKAGSRMNEEERIRKRIAELRKAEQI